MNYFLKDKLKEIVLQTDKLELCTCFLTGVSIGIEAQGADTTGNNMAVDELRKISKTIKQSVRQILLFEVGAAYYDFIHSADAGTKETDILKLLTGANK